MRWVHAWQLLFGVVLCGGLALSSARATEVDELAELERRIREQMVEVHALRDRVSSIRQRLARQQAEFDRVREAEAGTMELKSGTLAALKAQFERVLEDPDIELDQELGAYREAAKVASANQLALERLQQEISSSRSQAEQMDSRRATANADLAALRAGLDRARALRLRRELSTTGEVRVTNTITCDPDETISACSTRGQDEARARARERFAKQLLSGVTEADAVGAKLDGAPPLPELVSSDILGSGFLGQGDYRVEMLARLRYEASLEDACALLALSDAQCRGGAGALSERTGVADRTELADTPPSPDELMPTEPAVSEPTSEAERYQLTVRSNVYYDEVFIDGVPYGSTKLDVMLPPGEYEVEVRKPGHAAFKERVDLDASRTLRARLAEL